ncbi:MAG: hypothetical protein HFH41_13530 [Lachnospiraceae bacterium]|nr:hypothetical protein [Lachnospiraceae bacterium]
MNDLEGIPLAEYDIIDDYYSFGRQPLNDFSIYKFSNRYIWDAWNFDYRTADDEFIRNQAEKISHYKLLSPQKTETEIEKWTAYLIKLKENQVIRECFMVTNPSLCLSNHTLDGHTLRIVSGYIYVIYDNGTDDLLPRNQEGQLENNKWYRQKAKITVIRGVTNDSLEIWFGGLAPAELVPEEFLN